MQAKKGRQNNTRVSTYHLNADVGVYLPDQDVDATVIMLESYKAQTCSNYVVRCFSRKQSRRCPVKAPACCERRDFCCTPAVVQSLYTDYKITGYRLGTQFTSYRLIAWRCFFWRWRRMMTKASANKLKKSAYSLGSGIKALGVLDTIKRNSPELGVPKMPLATKFGPIL